MDPYKTGNDEIAAEEFMNEARTIADSLLMCGKIKRRDVDKAVGSLFADNTEYKMNNEDVEELCGDIFSLIEDCYSTLMFFDDPELRSKMDTSTVFPVMRVNAHFTVDSLTVFKTSTVYINEAVFCTCRSGKLVALYKKLLNDNDTVYVQYKCKTDRFGIASFKIKTVKKSKFNYDKLRKKDKIEKIFDRNGLVR